MKKFSVILILSLVAALALVWVGRNHPESMALLSAPPSAGAAKIKPLLIAVATNRDIHFAVTAAGEIGPVDTVSVRPEVGGLISQLSLDIGDRVKKGQVLFSLNDYDLQTEKATRKTEIAGARLVVETQKLQLEKSKLNFDRVKQLFETKLVSQEAFDNARVDLDLTKNSVDIALNRLETAQTALQQVEDKLSKTIIRAPFDCTILTRPVSVGQAVSGSSGFNSGTEVFTIANLADMVITAHINQSDVARLKVGQKVSVEVEAVAGLKLFGVVDRIAPQATFKNAVKGFSTRILLKNAEDAVRPGMTANLTIPLISADNVLAIPLSAVFSDQNERFVYVKKGENQYERRPIQTGVADYDYIEITQGLQSGETVSLATPPSDSVTPAASAGATASQAASSVPGAAASSGASKGSKP